MSRPPVTLVGIRTGRPGDLPLSPTGGRSSTADRLRLLLRLSVSEFDEMFPNRVNVEDRRRGRQLFRTLRGVVFVLGREAWRCLGMIDTEFFDCVYFPDRDTVYVLLPHPSGRNLMLNDRRVGVRMAHVLRQMPERYVAADTRGGGRDY